jgi:hypothetical protein
MVRGIERFGFYCRGGKWLIGIVMVMITIVIVIVVLGLLPTIQIRVWIPPPAFAHIPLPREAGMRERCVNTFVSI